MNDLKILQQLPESSTRKHLEEHINEQVDELIRDTREKRRDLFGIVLGLIFLALGIWLFVRGLEGSNLWFLPASILMLFGAAGLAQDAIPRRRDDRGRVIKEPPSDSSGT